MANAKGRRIPIGGHAKRKECTEEFYKIDDWYANKSMLLKQHKKKPKKVSSSSPPINREQVHDILNSLKKEKATPAKLCFYATKDPDTGDIGVSKEPIIDLALSDKAFFPFAVFRTDKGRYFFFDQRKINTVKNRYKDVSCYIGDNKLIFYAPGNAFTNTLVAVIMGLRMDDCDGMDVDYTESTEFKMLKDLAEGLWED